MKASWRERARVRDVLSREIGYIRKVHANRLRVALAFPNTYYVGMSNLGFQTAYRLFNALDEVVCERVFLPARQPRAATPAHGGLLTTLESGTAVADCEVLAFSVSFESDYPHVVSILRQAGLPLYAADRTEGHPLVVIGGAVTFLNPEPLAPFADVIAVGEGEVLIPSFVQVVSGSSSRQEALARLLVTPGFYVPPCVEVQYGPPGPPVSFAAPAGTHAVLPVRKAVLADPSSAEPPSTTIFTPDTEFGSRLLLEPVRGCANLCRFCWAGYGYLPVRAFDTTRLLQIAQAARPHARRVGLVSLALCDHPDLESLLEALLAMGYSIAPASLRLDELTEPIVKLLRAGGERSLTIAPEAGSDRLRRVINKPFTNADILERVTLIFASGFESLKLYFLVGLPTETDEDLVAIRDLTMAIRRRMLSQARLRGRLGHLTVTINPLIPKPGTAFQWLPLEDPGVTERKLRRLRSLFGGLDNVSLSIKSERQMLFQALLSLGDRRVAPAIELTARYAGDWRRALTESGVDPAPYLFRDRRQDTILPWDVIDAGVKPAFLRGELERALGASATSPPATCTEM